jgi:GT2 family glycosyltransferase/SAM-dependent methyltransferase
VLKRRAGAPRLIDWTGERCVPWAPDIPVVYEHFHRYFWAARLVAGRRVLDLGSGEGFGAAILAEAATEVVGVDVDRTSVDHANLNYAAPNLRFELGSALDLSSFEAASFDVVVSFEVIEHVADQQRVIAQIARVLAPDGLVVMSTPDRRAYSDATGQRNPFHERELTSDEFVGLLKGEFPQVVCCGQRTMTGSRIEALEPQALLAGPPATDFFISRVGDEWARATGMSALYLIGVASRGPLPSLPSGSTLADFDLTLLRELERETVLAAARAAAERAAAEEAHARTNALAAAAQREAAQAGAALEATNRRISHDLEEFAAATQFQIEQRDADVAAARSTADDLARRLEREREELVSLRRQARRLEESVIWRAFQGARTRLHRALGGEDSLRTRALSWSLRWSGDVLLRGRPSAPVQAPVDPEPARPIRFPQFEHPKVSLLVAIHARADLTEACLRSILNHTIGVSYEVILLDDAADAETKLLLGRVEGARKIVNETNIGFIQTVNRGAESARGAWLVVMNNDTEVTHRWLTAMLDCAESADDVGVVAPRYLYPDGRLQEAGALIWRDGSGVNVGRGEDPDACFFNYRRETDYGSGAALMVRTSLWRRVGGFDERFEPMYYEDADLCFQACELGLRVLYEPKAVVIHVEGATAGTDADPREKRHQELNRPKFVSKWRHRLERDHLRADVTNVRLASDRHRGPHVLVVDHRVLTWDRDAGSQRMLGIIKGFQSEGCHVTFLPNNLVATQPYTAELQRLGVAVLHGAIDLRAELATIGPRLRLVVLSRPHTASAWVDTFREVAPSARLVYDTVDLHWLREARRVGASLDASSLPPKAFALRELELAMMRTTDETWVVTEDEAAHVVADAPGTRTRIVPIAHDIEHHVPPADSRSGVVFVGGFEHTPNIEAALRLVREVMPPVWAEVGDVRVSIIGPNPPAEVRLLASPQVDVTGWVDDLKPVLRLSRLLVAPLSYGAGLKGKVTQALAAGLPVVTTPIGVEGFELLGEEQILVGSSSAELARHVIRAYQDDDLWQRLSRGGQDLARRYCSAEVIAEQLRDALEASGSEHRLRLEAADG